MLNYTLLVVYKKKDNHSRESRKVLHKGSKTVGTALAMNYWENENILYKVPRTLICKEVRYGKVEI